jgi:hypothetical protein
MVGKKVYKCTSRDGNENVASNKMRDNWTKTAQYLIKYKQKWERSVKRVTKEMKRGKVTMK